MPTFAVGRKPVVLTFGGSCAPLATAFDARKSFRLCVCSWLLSCCGCMFFFRLQQGRACAVVLHTPTHRMLKAQQPKRTPCKQRCPPNNVELHNAVAVHMKTMLVDYGRSDHVEYSMTASLSALRFMWS